MTDFVQDARYIAEPLREIGKLLQWWGGRGAPNLGPLMVARLIVQSACVCGGGLATF